MYFPSCPVTGPSAAYNFGSCSSLTAFLLSLPALHKSAFARHFAINSRIARSLAHAAPFAECSAASKQFWALLLPLRFLLYLKPAANPVSLVLDSSLFHADQTWPTPSAVNPVLSLRVAGVTPDRRLESVLRVMLRHDLSLQNMNQPADTALLNCR